MASAPATVHRPVVLDVAGLELTAVDRARLADPLVGGLILFGRNWHDRAQLSQLCADIKAVRQDIVISVDHEGGRVQRFKTDGFTPIPAMRRLGQVWDAKRGDSAANALRASDLATACGFVLASELRACGVDLSFAPVLDLDWGGSSVIGERAFHADARVVTVLAKAVMHGMLLGGMGNCGKHFPGHGFARGDSHHDVPVDKRSFKAIMQDDAAPYGWLSQCITGVMPAHVIYSKVDSKPAGFSAHWLQTVLRGQLGFEGCVFSDDLSMAAARVLEGRELTYTEAALAALTAGCDQVLLCNQSVGNGEEVDELLAGLASAQRSRAWAPQASSEARRLGLLPRSPAESWRGLSENARYSAARAALTQLG